MRSAREGNLHRTERRCERRRWKNRVLSAAAAATANSLGTENKKTIGKERQCNAVQRESVTTTWANENNAVRHLCIQSVRRFCSRR